VRDVWTPNRLDAIERRCPTREVRALVAEIRRLNTIVVCAGGPELRSSRLPSSRSRS
jgi:hypothetical protein